MVDTTKKIVTKSLTADMRRSAKRLHEQMLKAWLTEEEASRKRAPFETPQQKRKYSADMQIVDRLDPGFRGEISYKMLGNKRIRVDSPEELTRMHGILRKTTKVLKRNAETGDVYLALHKKKTWSSVSSHLYAEDGTLRAKHVKYKDGRFEEKWERDENGLLIRTKYVNRNRLFHPISEKVSEPYRAGTENRLFRELTRQKGAKQETFERDDKGNLELIGSKRLGFSKNSTKAADRQTSRTKIRKLGGAFSKSYRSLLDKEGNELGRDISSHRRLFNKRSAVYDDASGQLTSTKHTFGKIYKSETAYLNEDVKQISKKILGVTVRRKLTTLNQQERDAQTLRNSESTDHRRAWQESAALPKSPQQQINVNLVRPSQRVNLVRDGRGDDDAELRIEPATERSIDVIAKTSPLLRLPNPKRQVSPQTPPQSSNARFSDPHSLAKGVESGGSSVSRTESESSLASLFQFIDHQPDPKEQELLSSLHSVPFPPPFKADGALGGRIEDSIREASGDSRVRTSSVLASVVNDHLQVPLERDHSVNSISERFDPQALFGEPDPSRVPEKRPELSTEGDHLTNSEQQALLNELLNMPLPGGLPKADHERSMILERSGSRGRSMSGGLSL
ncbi:virA/G regulated protein [Agrobacterium larrymoorei]|uniref:VirA/G regulated protein n=1 Tax=Agrobacterium larrymoorei TaxID=160699 RepID=A0A4D7E4A2_9HYPH|nr:virA/G regulated protein [Agrobacterium larrymoorei]QCJ00993.1 virA/G regulated protein [Agrobacterium larrymoorei]QYA10331.1 virA/G regulated protein [Agrobacterium larrymoorei]